MDTTITATLSILAVSLILAGLWKHVQSRKTQHFPPGPKPKPLIGNLFDIPTSNAPQVYAEWGSTYNSDILFASALGSHVLILNKREDAFELLEKRSHKYSDRPSWPVIKLVGWEGNIALMRYGNFWRLHKKVGQQNFRKEAARQYNPIQLEKVKLLLRNLLDNPEDFEQHNKLFSVGVPLATMYGYDVDSVDDPCIKAADKSALLAGKLFLPGESLINVFPFLQYVPTWFPGAVSQRIAAKARKLTAEAIRVPMDNLKSRMAKGPVAASLVSSFMDKQSLFETSDQEAQVIKNIAYTVYGAASETTTSATSTFFYLMATHPEVQRKAQSEIDRFVGSGALPTFEDRKLLPYIDAVYREVLRWRPPLAICVPHILTEDDYYKGYFIPKGTTVLPNLFAMTRDDNAYDKPFDFSPERFLDENGALNNDDRILAYGFGRRICVGRHIASSSMWLVIASVLATFNIGKAKDGDGNEIPIQDDYFDFNGFMQNKAPFKCSITPRSDRVKGLFME